MNDLNPLLYALIISKRVNFHWMKHLEKDLFNRFYDNVNSDLIKCKKQTQYVAYAKVSFIL